MENTTTDPQAQTGSGSGDKPQLTPHQLYNYHILHPNEPITDEDIRNLKIDSGGVYKDHKLRDGEPVVTETDEEQKDSHTDEEKNTDDQQRPIESPYDILGG